MDRQRPDVERRETLAEGVDAGRWLEAASPCGGVVGEDLHGGGADQPRPLGGSRQPDGERKVSADPSPAESRQATRQHVAARPWRHAPDARLGQAGASLTSWMPT